jgi:hypothetical protein
VFVFEYINNLSAFPTTAEDRERLIAVLADQQQGAIRQRRFDGVD